MKHAALQRRVQAAERRLAEHIAMSKQQVASLRADAREAATPTRIVLGGAIGGFLLGLAAPLSRVGGVTSLPKLLQVATGVVGFVNALRVQQAAEDTEQAAAEVSDASQRIEESV